MYSIDPMRPCENHGRFKVCVKKLTVRAGNSTPLEDEVEPKGVGISSWHAKSPTVWEFSLLNVVVGKNKLIVVV